MGAGRRKPLVLVAAAAVAGLVAMAACDAKPETASPKSGATAVTPATNATTDTSAPTADAPAADRGTVIVAAGDIACQPGNPSYNGGAGTPTACRQRATSDLVARIKPKAVLVLGDLQYEKGFLADFRSVYDRTWGRFNAITWPAAGNHEYGTGVAPGYYSYFGQRAAEKRQGYYSTDIGGWHVVALNSNCRLVGGCQRGSPQERWLRADLASHRNVCTLAFWHHPRWSSGLHGSDASLDGVWQTMADTGVDVALAGHDHDYERFAPIDAAGNVDPARGTREFVVGTGGRSLYFFASKERGSEARDWQTFGVLKLTLRARSYDWEFVPAAGGTFSDSGSGSCH
jgi:hypothetical protein